MVKNKIVLVLMLFILSIIAPSFAANVNEPHTYYVSTIGNDANNGLDWEHSKKNIIETIEIAENGDTIIVAPGTYKEEKATEYYMKSPKNIKIIGIDKPIFDGKLGRAQTCFWFRGTCLIQDLILKDCNILNSGNLTIKGCEFAKSDPNEPFMSESLTNGHECRLINCSFPDLHTHWQIHVEAYDCFSCVYMTNCTFESKYKKNKSSTSPILEIIDKSHKDGCVVWDQFTRDQILANGYGIKEADKEFCYLENQVPQKIKDRSPFLFKT